MLSGIEFESIEINFSQITIPGWKLSNVPEVTFSCETYHPVSKTGVLTRDCAIFLLKLHPLVVWKEKGKEKDDYNCVLGQRILKLTAPHLYSKDKLRVWNLPQATEDQVKVLQRIELLVNQMAYSTMFGGKGIFETSRLMDKNILDAISPILNLPVDQLAKLFTDCGSSTLYKLNSKIDASPQT